MSKLSERLSEEHIQRRRVGGFNGRPLASLSAFVIRLKGCQVGVGVTSRTRRACSKPLSNSLWYPAAFDNGSPQNAKIKRTYAKESVVELKERIVKGGIGHTAEKTSETSLRTSLLLHTVLVLSPPQRLTRKFCISSTPESWFCRTNPVEFQFAK
jgi:hypothetical protein